MIIFPGAVNRFQDEIKFFHRFFGHAIARAKEQEDRRIVFFPLVPQILIGNGIGIGPRIRRDDVRFLPFCGGDCFDSRFDGRADVDDIESLCAVAL